MICLSLLHSALDCFFQTPRRRFFKTGLHRQISIRFCGLSIRIPVNSLYPCLVYLRRKPRQHSIVVLGCTHLFSSHHFLQVVSVIVCEVSLSLAFLVMCLRLQRIKVTLSGAISNLRGRWKSYAQDSSFPGCTWKDYTLGEFVLVPRATWPPKLGQIEASSR